MGRAVVNTLAADGSTALPQMNADLMGAAGLQAALDDAVFAKIVHNAHVGDRPLAVSGFRRGPASVIAPIRDEVRLNSAGPRSPPNYGQISPFNAMGTKLL